MDISQVEPNSDVGEESALPGFYLKMREEKVSGLIVVIRREGCLLWKQPMVWYNSNETCLLS